MNTEKELLIKLDAAEKEIKSIRGKINTTLSLLWEQESELLTVQILKGKLLKELKETREQSFDPTDEAREKEISDFRKTLPALMERIEKEEK